MSSSPGVYFGHLIKCVSHMYFFNFNEEPQDLTGLCYFAKKQLLSLYLQILHHKTE